METLKLVLTGALGTAGFAILFSIRPRHVPFAIIGGAIATLVYVLVDIAVENAFVSNFVATLVCVVYANIFARLLKTPSIVFITASVIPLVPGGSLFYTMSNLILGNLSAAKMYGLNTLKVALGIAGGIVVESLVVSVMMKISHMPKTVDTNK